MFAATGALADVAAGVSSSGLVLLATLTAVGGGWLSNLLLTTVPVVPRDDFYVTPAIARGVALLAVPTVGVSPPAPTVTCVAVSLGLRLATLRYECSSPTL